MNTAVKSPSSNEDGIDAPALGWLPWSSLRSIFSRAKRVFRDRRFIVRQAFVVQAGRIGCGARSFILHRTLVDVLIPCWHGHDLKNA